MLLFTCKPKKISIYLNTYPYKTIEEIKNETGCDIIFNGQMYNSDATPCQTMRADGVTLAYEANYLGYGWNNADVSLTLTRDYEAYDNFVSCVPLVNDSQALPLEPGVDYPTALDGTRGRTAIGMLPDGQLLLYCGKDGTDGAMSMEVMQTYMLGEGCVTALNLDGGGSSSCITPIGSVSTPRRIYNYICVWIENVPKTIYRVQVGAYLLKANAEKMLAQLQAEGFTSSYVKKSGLIYRVQVGAFANKAYADRLMERLTECGYKAFITTK